MFQRILVLLDGSARAEWAIPVAAQIARISYGSLFFVRVIAPTRDTGAYGAESTIGATPNAFEKHFADANAYLHEVVHTYANELQDIAVETEVEVGSVSSGIISAAYMDVIDLIVMCSHGETGLKHWFLKHAAQQTIRRSPVPVLIVNESGTGLPEPDGRRPLRVLIPLDGSELAEAALAPTAQFIKTLALPGQQIVLHLLGVVDIPPVYGRMRSQTHIDLEIQRQARDEAEVYLQSVAKRLEKEVLRTLHPIVTVSVMISTDVAGTIMQQAEQPTDAQNIEGCDLITMATHGRGGIQRLLVGSVTEHILRSTRLPLLVVRPHEKANALQAEEIMRIDTAMDASSWVGLL
jgi:nucleotide-binding universal stress UspA family protein